MAAVNVEKMVLIDWFGWCLRLHECTFVRQIMTKPAPSLRRWYSSALDDTVHAMLHKQEQHRPSAKQVHLTRLALLAMGGSYVDLVD